MTNEELQTALDNERQRADNAVDLSYQLQDEVNKLEEKISALESTLDKYYYGSKE